MVRSFPKAVRAQLGIELFRLQCGEMPLDSKPMKSIGQGVFELRDRDTSGWYRLIYLTKMAETVYALHGFVKRSAKTPAKDLAIARNRLKALRMRLQREKEK